MPDYVKRAPTTRFSARRFQFGEPVEGELLDLIRRSSIEAEAVEVPQWRALLIRSGDGIRDVVLVGDGMWLVFEYDRGYLTAWDDGEFTAEFELEG